MSHQRRGRERVILGISDSFNCGAAVVVDGRIAAAVSEERLCRVKMVMGWPRLAIEEALRIAGLTFSDVELVAVATENLYWRPQAQEIGGYYEGKAWGWDKRLMIRLGGLGARLLGDLPVARRPYYAAKRLLCGQRRAAVPVEMRKLGIEAPVRFFDHHLAHAASAYYTGGEPDANIATLDGAGDNLSATIYRGRQGHLERAATVSSYDSVGNFYSYVTHVLGFKAHRHEGKVMGLAAYGEPRHVDLFRELVRYREGTIENRARAFDTTAIRKIRRRLPADAEKADVAASIQTHLEDVCVRFVDHWLGKLGRRHLGLAGGVVANVKLNQRLAALDQVSSLSVFPAMGDDGLAVGAALQAHAEGLSQSRRGDAVGELADVYLGPSFPEALVEGVVRDSGLEFSRPADMAAEIAALLEAHKVVARFDGRMEYGPRALGSRSILAHPGDPTVNDWLNNRLGRTEFMPFAPVTLEEDVPRCYLGLSKGRAAAEFMAITCDCTEFFKEVCPATVHVDGTARPQIVSRRPTDTGYRDILEAFRQRTGLPALINTSFNMHEEPIVCTPRDAMRAFSRGHLDHLAIGPFLVGGSRQPGS